MDDLKYPSGAASLFVTAARRVKPEAAIEACQKLVDAIDECNVCNGKGRIIDDDACPNCGGTGVQIGSVGLILSEALPLALDALDEVNRPFEDYLRRLFKGGE